MITEYIGGIKKQGRIKWKIQCPSKDYRSEGTVEKEKCFSPSSECQVEHVS